MYKRQDTPQLAVQAAADTQAPEAAEQAEVASRPAAEEDTAAAGARAADALAANLAASLLAQAANAPAQQEVPRRRPRLTSAQSLDILLGHESAAPVGAEAPRAAPPTEAQATSSPPAAAAAADVKAVLGEQAAECGAEAVGQDRAAALAERGDAAEAAATGEGSSRVDSLIASIRAGQTGQADAASVTAAAERVPEAAATEHSGDDAPSVASARVTHAAEDRGGNVELSAAACDAADASADVDMAVVEAELTRFTTAIADAAVTAGPQTDVDAEVSRILGDFGGDAGEEDDAMRHALRSMLEDSIAHPEAAAKTAAAMRNGMGSEEAGELFQEAALASAAAAGSAGSEHGGAASSVFNVAVDGNEAAAELDAGANGDTAADSGAAEGVAVQEAELADVAAVPPPPEALGDLASALVDASSAPQAAPMPKTTGDAPGAKSSDADGAASAVQASAKRTRAAAQQRSCGTGPEPPLPPPQGRSAADFGDLFDRAADATAGGSGRAHVLRADQSERLRYRGRIKPSASVLPNSRKARPSEAALRRARSHAKHVKVSPPPEPASKKQPAPVHPRKVAAVKAAAASEQLKEEVKKAAVMRGQDLLGMTGEGGKGISDYVAAAFRPSMPSNARSLLEDSEEEAEQSRERRPRGFGSRN